MSITNMSDLSTHIDIEDPPFSTDRSSNPRKDRRKASDAGSMTSEPSTRFDIEPPPMRAEDLTKGKASDPNSKRTDTTDTFNPVTVPRLPRRAPSFPWIANDNNLNIVSNCDIQYYDNRRVAVMAPSEINIHPMPASDGTSFNPMTVPRLPRRVVTQIGSPLIDIRPANTTQNDHESSSILDQSFYGKQYSERRQQKASTVKSANIDILLKEDSKRAKSPSQTDTENLYNLFNEPPPKSTSGSSRSGIFGHLSRAPSQAASEKIERWASQSVHASPPETPLSPPGVKVLPTHDAAGNMLRHILVAPGALISTEELGRPGDSFMMHMVQHDRVNSSGNRGSARAVDRKSIGAPENIESRSGSSSRHSRSQADIQPEDSISNKSGSTKRGGTSNFKFSPDKSTPGYAEDVTANMPGSFQPDAIDDRHSDSAAGSATHRSNRSSKHSRFSADDLSKNDLIDSTDACQKAPSGSNKTASKSSSGRSRQSHRISEQAAGSTENKSGGGSKTGSTRAGFDADTGGFTADPQKSGLTNANVSWD